MLLPAVGCAARPVPEGTRPMKMSCPVLPLRGTVVFPGMIRVLTVGRDTSVRAVVRHLDKGLPLLLVPQRDADVEDPTEAPLADVGVLADALRYTRLPDGSLR